MAIVDSTGTKLTKAQLLAKATQVTQDPLYEFNEDIWETSQYPGAKAFEDGVGAKRAKLFHAGEKVRQSVIDKMYTDSAATVDTIAPATGLAAGNLPVTITGSGFAGVRGVTFGGTAATNFKVVSDTKITCNTPPHAAGAVNVVVQDASGDVTKTNGFTYS
jgi:hypothetical protein